MQGPVSSPPCGLWRRVSPSQGFVLISRPSGSAVPLCPSAWLLLQAPQWVFQEGEPISLQCHSWKNVTVRKVQYFQDGRGKQFSYKNTKFHIPKAMRRHGGSYFCRGIIGTHNVSSEAANITVLGERGAGLRGPEPRTWGVGPHCLAHRLPYVGLSEGPLTLRCDSRSRSHLFFLSPFIPRPQRHVSPPCLPAFICGLTKSQPGRSPSLCSAGLWLIR